MPSPFLITHIGPWTFLYGLLFSILAIVLWRLTRAWVGLVFLIILFFYMRDLPGTILAFSLYTVYLLKPFRITFNTGEKT